MEEKKNYLLQIKEQFGAVDVHIQIPCGFTDKQAEEIEKRLNDYTERYEGKHGDYEGFDIKEALETVLDEMNLQYKDPPVDYIIHI